MAALPEVEKRLEHLSGDSGHRLRFTAGSTMPTGAQVGAGRSVLVITKSPSAIGASAAYGDQVVDYSYLRDAKEIYRRSFATIRAEADLSGLPPEIARVAVRMIHTCGMTDLPADLGFSPNVVAKAHAALAEGAPVLCDATMVASGITRRRLPAKNEVVCTLNDPAVPELAAKLGTTRSAAAVDLWGDRLAGAVVAIGNAPTALFRLLELIDAGATPPAAVVGVPVGFVGAAESKQALAEHPAGLEYLVVHGRRGGSALAAAAINAIASPQE